MQYATKAKVDHAIRMARLAGIERIGTIELAPDGTIRLSSEGPRSAIPALSVEDEVQAWRESKAQR